jgi:hypothetical protein
MKKILLFILLAASFKTFAQLKIKTLEVSDTIVFAAVDRPGDFYLVLKDGQIQKFDKDGKLAVVYRHKTVPTLFDPRDGARLFAYYRKNQEYDYLNPSFDAVTSYRIDSAFVIEPWLICISGDHKLWVLDAADHSLKKVNVKDSEVEIEVKIDTSLIQNAESFSTMREYQGFVFLLNSAKGIFVFNSLGKYIKTIPAKGIHHFNFLGEELYFLKDNKINFFDLFSGESREASLLHPSKMVLLTDERMLLIQWKTVEIFEFKP